MLMLNVISDAPDEPRESGPGSGAGPLRSRGRVQVGFELL